MRASFGAIDLVFGEIDRRESRFRPGKGYFGTPCFHSHGRIGGKDWELSIGPRRVVGRLGEPEEIASIAVFLACRDSSYITGQTVYADGGRLGLNYVVPVPDQETD